MNQQRGFMDPIIDLIEKYLKYQSSIGGFGLGSDTGGGNDYKENDGNKLIDHTHEFESDEPSLLKPIRLIWDGNRLKQVICGQGTLKITTELFYNDLGKFYKVVSTYPDGVEVPFELQFQYQNEEQRGKLLRVL